MGVSDQILPKIAEVVLWHCAEAVYGLLTGPVLPQSTELRVVGRQVVGGDELCGSVRVVVRADMVLNFDWHFSHPLQLIGQEPHRLGALNR